MTEMKNYAPNTFCWVDLATTDAKAAKNFYTGFFDWSANDMPADDSGVYTMFEKNGKSVCALYEMSEEMKGQGIPPAWNSYVSVVNVDKSAEKVLELGGEIVEAPFDVMDVGRMAVVKDLEGATFSLWQPAQHMGAELVNEPGTFCWNELYYNDAKTAIAFYRDLFGWTTETIEGAAAEEYTVFYNGDQMAAGALQIQKEWGEVPPNWTVYFAVDDCNGALEKAKDLSGTVEVEPMEVKDVGLFAVLRDPQGAYFDIIELNKG